MSALFDRFLKSLPMYLDISPQPERGITLTYDGAAGQVTVERRRLITKVAGGSGDTVTVHLQGLTLQGLVDTLNAQPGYTAALAASDGTLPAISLIETQKQNFFLEPYLNRFTSLLWCLTLPLSWALLDAIDNLNAGFLQMSLKTAEGSWMDLWGDYYGQIRRLPAENDRTYAERIIFEVLRWRLNGKALEVIIKEETGLDCTVVNLHDYAAVYNTAGHGYGSKLAGWKYSRTTFEIRVSVPAFSTSLYQSKITLLVNRNRAAGTMPFFAFLELPVIFTDQVTAQNYVVSFGVPTTTEPTDEAGIAGWDLGGGQWLGIFDGQLQPTDVQITNAVPKPPDITFTVDNGVFSYVPNP